MGIFDDLIQGINREIGRVQAKSQEMMQSYSLISQIRSLEAKINAAYIEMGKLVYDKYERGREVLEDSLREKASEIAAWEQEIAGLKVELETIKAQFSPDTPASQKADARAGYTPTPGFNCPHCEAPANAEKSFCPLCGGSLKDAAEPQKASTGGNGDSPTEG